MITIQPNDDDNENVDEQNETKIKKNDAAHILIN